MTDETAGITAAYCCVTVVAGHRCVDLALPVALPLADLMPGIVRLLAPIGDAQAAGDTEGADRDSDSQWRLTPIGASPLPLTRTLDAAGVLDGDVLMLLNDSDAKPSPVIGTVRDVVEQGVDTACAVGGSRGTGQWVQWTVLLSLLGLLIPVTALPLPACAALAACGAAIAGALAVQVGRGNHSVCAATGVATSGLYAAVAGASIVGQWLGDDNGTPDMLVLPALFCALVATSAAALWWRPAVVATAAVGISLIAATAVTLARSSGLELVTAALGVAVAMVLVLGGLPRVVLAASGLIHADAHDERLADRLEAAERWLTGCLTGAAGAALAAVLPAVAIDDRTLHLLVAGIGCLMLVRARAFTLVCHTIGPRVAGTLVVAAVWWAQFRDAPASRADLVVGAFAALAALLIAQALAGTERTGPVTAARVERAFDVAEWLLVVAVLLGTAAQMGLASWAATVLQ